MHTFTREDFGKELKQKVAQKQDIKMIASWAFSVYLHSHSDFNDLLLTLTTMEEGPEFAYTYEELDRIADDLIAGKDVKL